jgi:hypothetical protein
MLFVVPPAGNELDADTAGWIRSIFWLQGIDDTREVTGLQRMLSGVIEAYKSNVKLLLFPQA